MSSGVLNAWEIPESIRQKDGAPNGIVPTGIFKSTLVSWVKSKSGVPERR